MVFTPKHSSEEAKVSSKQQATAIGGSELKWRSFFNSQRYWGAVVQKERRHKHDSKHH